MGKITHQKIAQIAGVSQSSVSKALAGSHEISEETLQKILKIAEELGYFGQKKKEKRMTGRYYRPYIAIVVPEIISLNYATEVTMLVKALDSIRADGRIHLSGFSDEEYERTVREILQNEYADGILSFYDRIPVSDPEIPFICITQFGVNLKGDLVSSNLTGGMKAAIQHLVDLGHRRIGFIGETNTLPKERLFQQIMQELSLESQYIYSNDNRFEMCGHAAILEMLDSQHLFPTAFICAYDEIAYGAINQLKLYGYSVPEDFSIIGMNDVAFSKVMEPELTTIVIHSDELCGEAVKLLEEALHGERKAARHIEVQCDLAIRKSTAKPRTRNLF